MLTNPNTRTKRIFNIIITFDILQMDRISLKN